MPAINHLPTPGQATRSPIETDVQNNRVCAVVVAYHPDTLFEQRLSAILSQVELLVLVDNTPGEAGSLRPKPPAHLHTSVQLVQNPTNIGIAAALNQGLQLALEAGCQWLLTLDQDTQCYSDMVQTLLQAAASCNPKPTVVGANYFDAKRKRHEAPPDDSQRCIERKTVITSGCLVDATFAHEVGGFRDDYFIDQVDHEFCLRIRAHSGRVVITSRPAMDHCVGGETGPKVPFLGQMLPDHSALRKYYITRNTITTVATYWKREPEWCMRRVARLLTGFVSMTILERNKLLKMRAFAVGMADGFLGRMGPCRRKSLDPALQEEKRDGPNSD